MSEGFHLITVASWEDRFILGLRRMMEGERPATIQMYYFREYESQSSQNREEAKSISTREGVLLAERAVEFGSPAKTWNALAADVAERGLGGTRVIVDITTMPRDVIWSVFFHLRNAGASIEYVYHRPLSYSKDWLSRDPGKPRLLFKMSGVVRFDRQTALVLTTGYDSERTQQLIRYFEPQRVALFLQTGRQFANEEQNVASHQKLLEEERREYKLDAALIDAYSLDHGEERMARWVVPHLADYNIILSSLGPKLSAVAMFHLHARHPEIALCYAPSNEFNPEYSEGIGETVTGRLDHGTAA
jgi:hypothetical protein